MGSAETVSYTCDVAGATDMKENHLFYGELRH